MENIKLEAYIPPIFLEEVKRLIKEHNELSDREFYEKNISSIEAFEELWPNYEDYIDAEFGNNRNKRFSFWLVHYLIDKGYVVQEDGQTDIEYILDFVSDDIENMWDVNVNMKMSIFSEMKM